MLGGVVESAMARQNEKLESAVIVPPKSRTQSGRRSLLTLQGADVSELESGRGLQETESHR